MEWFIPEKLLADVEDLELDDPGMQALKFASQSIARQKNATQDLRGDVDWEDIMERLGDEACDTCETSKDETSNVSTACSTSYQPEDECAYTGLERLPAEDTDSFVPWGADLPWEAYCASTGCSCPVFCYGAVCGYGALGLYPPEGWQNWQYDEAGFQAPKPAHRGRRNAEKTAQHPRSRKQHAFVPRRVNLVEQYRESEDNPEPFTTLMVRNVPNHYDRSQLMNELDELGLYGKYDFLYLPIDSATTWNVGYAFINFEHPADASLCKKLMKGYEFQHSRLGRRRLAQVTNAHLQGLEKNLAHLNGTKLFVGMPGWQRPWVRRQRKAERKPVGQVFDEDPLNKQPEYLLAQTLNMKDAPAVYHTNTAKSSSLTPSSVLGRADLLESAQRQKPGSNQNVYPSSCDSGNFAVPLSSFEAPRQTFVDGDPIRNKELARSFVAAVAWHLEKD